MVDRFNRNIFTTGTVTYTDFDLNFRTNPVTGDIAKKTDLESIKQSIKNLLYTGRGERPFQPDMEGGLNDLLFEQLDNITAEILKDQIRTVIENHEPRVSIIAIDVVDSQDENTLNVTLKFNMVNVLEPQELDIVLKRLR